LLRRPFIDLPCQIIEEWIFHDLLIKGRILSTAMLTRIIHKEFTLGDVGRSKGIGLKDIRPRLQESAMDIADHVRLREREQVSIVQEVLLRVFEAIPTDICFRHPIGTDCRAHRSINDGDSILEDFLKRMLMSFCHSF
jgi:hypothetical protein